MKRFVITQYLSGIHFIHIQAKATSSNLFHIVIKDAQICVCLCLRRLLVLTLLAESFQKQHMRNLHLNSEA